MEIVRIKLSPEAYEFLIKQLPQGGTVHRALEQAELIRSHLYKSPLGYEFDCDEDIAISLLRYSQRYCPQAVTEIDFALRAAPKEERRSRRRGLIWG
jgi:hypothetical protein